MIIESSYTYTACEFCLATLVNKIAVKLTLPLVNMILPDKHMY